MIGDRIPCGVCDTIDLQTVVCRGFTAYLKWLVSSEVRTNLKDAARSLLAKVAVTGGHEQGFALNRDVHSTASALRSSRHTSKDRTDPVRRQQPFPTLADMTHVPEHAGNEAGRRRTSFNWRWPGGLRARLHLNVWKSLLAHPPRSVNPNTQNPSLVTSSTGSSGFQIGEPNSEPGHEGSR